MKIKLKIKDFLAVVPVVFAIAKESIQLWRIRDRSCEKCAYWAKGKYNSQGVDADCSNSHFNVNVNAVLADVDGSLITLAMEQEASMIVLVNRTFCCKYFKRKKN